MDDMMFFSIIICIWIVGFYFSIKQHRDRIEKLEKFRDVMKKKFPDIENE